MPRPVAPKRRAVAAVVVDQLGSWILQLHAREWAGAKPGDPRCHGFCRLMHEGAFYERMEYAHAITDTAPGHATLFTGVTPREHGICQNEKAIADPKLPGGTIAVGVLYDEHAHLVDAAGATAVVGPSLRELRVPTVADDLRAADPTACIVSVSIKDRAALFGGGRHPTATLFYEPALGTYVTSSAVADRMPAVKLPVLPPPETRVWRPLDAPWLAAHAPTADDQVGEGDYHGLGTTFPHRVSGAGSADASPRAAYRMTPFADEDVRAVARQSLALCKHSDTTFVATSFSSHDYVAHTFGPHSWEAYDQFQRLDRTLEGWLSDLDAEFGADGWSLVLSADHGSSPLPELARRPWCHGDNPWSLPCDAGVRLGSGSLFARLEARATRELGPGPWIGTVTDPRVVLSPRAHELPTTQRRQLLAALEAELLATGGVERVIDLTLPLGDCGADVLGRDDADLVRRTVCQSQSTTPSAAGDLYVVVKRGSFFDAGYTLGKGESHGSPWLYDRAVPLLVRVPHGQPERHPEPVSFRRYAHTLRQWLGLPQP